MIFRHHPMWVQSSGTPLRAECVHCGEELERTWQADWASKSARASVCRARQDERPV